jgi:hypothetical protein
MARATPIVTSLNAGEWSPLMYGRPDLGKFGNAARLLINMIGLVEGGATRRPGTRFVASTKDNGVARAIRFQFSTVQAYIIEMGHLYFRFYRDRKQIAIGDPPVPYEIAHTYTLAQLAQIKFIQSADTLYLWHPSHPPRKLTRTGHTAWTISTIVFEDGPYLNQNVTNTTLTPSALTGAVNITASALAGINGGLGFQASTDVGRLVRLRHGANWGVAVINSVTTPLIVAGTVIPIFSETGVAQGFGAMTATTRWRLGAWSDGLGWPGCGVFHEERLWHGFTVSQPQTLWSSVSNDFENMAPTTRDNLTLADSAITYTIADAEVNAILWLASADVLRIGTSGGEYIGRASALNEAMTPDNILVRRQTSRKAADMMPVTVDRAVLFAQKTRREFYEQLYNFEADSYLAGDLSRLARHMTRPKIKELSYAASPWSLIWAVRDDGVPIAMTYLREQDVVGWGRHILGGRAGLRPAKVLSAATIDGPNQDETWFIVERTINGATKRYLEFVEEEFAEDEELKRLIGSDPVAKELAFFVDSGLTYDGWNADPSKTLTLLAVDWTAGTTGTMEAVGHAPFSGADLGREFRFRQLDMGIIKPVVVRIDSVISAAMANVTFMTAVPAALQNVAVDWWARCATILLGLEHLEGQTVQILVDGATHPDLVVAGGQVTLSRQAARAHVGLGYESLVQPMNFEQGSAEGSARGKQKRFPELTLSVVSSLGGDYGSPGKELTELEYRQPDDPMDDSPPLFTGEITVKNDRGWSKEAQLLLRQRQPLPFTVTSISPQLVVNEG